jgi:hypothetical protein
LLHLRGTLSNEKDLTLNYYNLFMLLVLTHSQDVTTDAVLNFLPDLEVFRFNIDLWRDYDWQVNQNTFILRDPIGRECSDAITHAVYLRKLLFQPVLIDVPAGGSEEAWTRGEVEALWLGLRDLAMETQRLALVHPSPYGRWNKIRQMRVASQFFRVPEWSAYHSNTCPLEGSVVVKSFGQSNIGKGGILAVREVNPGQLSPDYPWFVQKSLSKSTHDVTIACVGEKIFAYQLSRDSFEGEDCRFPSVLQSLPWQRFELTREEEKKVRDFMEATGFTFGRLDFLRDDQGLWFLEINPNGQFAWLDAECKDGLIEAVADAIRQVHQRNS